MGCINDGGVLHGAVKKKHLLSPNRRAFVGHTSSGAAQSLHTGLQLDVTKSLLAAWAMGIRPCQASTCQLTIYLLRILSQSDPRGHLQMRDGAQGKHARATASAIAAAAERCFASNPCEGILMTWERPL